MTIGYDPEMPPVGTKPQFPPLLDGVETAAGVDPFEKAVADAQSGRSEVGNLYWSPDDDTLRAAIVFEPEEPLADAAPILFAVANGLNDCIGALAPPEVGLQHVWPVGVNINGALGGGYRVQASSWDDGSVPEWLVVGLELAITSNADDPGRRPDITALAEEGCGHLSRIRLLESWSRHTLVWVNRWSDDGFRPIFEAWLARADGRGGDVTVQTGDGPVSGTFLGLDEHGGLLLKTGEGPRTIPLLDTLQREQGRTS